MAWTTPMTAVAGQFTAAQWNTHIRDNLNVTAAAIATSGSSRWFVSSATNVLAMREFKHTFIDTEETRSSTTFGDLTTVGPAVTITTGTKALVVISCWMGNDTADTSTQATFNITGATSFTGDVQEAVITDGMAASASNDNLRYVSVGVLRTVTAGSNTFTMKYRVPVTGTGRFKARRITVWSF